MAQTIQLNQDKINEGKLLVGLGKSEQGLAEQQKANTNQTTSMLERLVDGASLVKGIIQGNFEQGQWKKALELVYTNATVQGLFDNDWDALANDAIEYAKQQTKEYQFDLDQGSLCREVLKRWKPEDIVRLIVETPMNTEDANELFKRLPKQTMSEQLGSVFNALGERSLKNSTFGFAKWFFEAIHNVSGLAKTYDVWFEKMSQYNVEQLLDFAGTFPDRNEKRKQIIRKTLDTLADNAQALSKLFNYQELMCQMNVTDEEKEKIKKAYASQLFEGEINRGKQPDDIKLLWAKSHANEWDFAQSAYKIMQSANYSGNERKQAVKKMVQHGKLKEIEEQDLRAIREEFDLDSRIRITYHLDDKEDMRKLSKLCAKESNNSELTDCKRNSMLREAYFLWITGEGDDKNKFVQYLRNRLLECDLAEGGKRISYYGIGRWLEHTDKTGIAQAFELALTKNNIAAYTLAKQFDDNQKIVIAREKMIAESPEEALRVFNPPNGGGEKDTTGVELAVDALSKKYSVRAERVYQLIANFNKY